MYYYDSHMGRAVSVPTLAYEINSKPLVKPAKPALRHSRLEPTRRLALQVTVIVDAQAYPVVSFASKVAAANLRTR